MLAAFFTGYLDPYWCFAYYGFFGIIVTIVACFLNSELEKENLKPTALLATENQTEVAEGEEGRDSDFRNASEV